MAFPLCAPILALASATAFCRNGSEAVERTPNGAVVRYSGGVVRVEVCSASVLHIVNSPTDALAQAVVPVAIRPCGHAKFTTSSDSSGAHILTRTLRVDVSASNGVARFSTRDGQTILSEEPNHGRILGTADGQGHLSSVEQRFLLSPEESLYGLGQHQDGTLDMRNVPVRLLQANTDIAIPFLISTKGYGLLWNNPALTDFNPATEPVQLDENGAGTFHTGPEGTYGFLLSGNYRKKLRLSVDGHQILDLQNMWVPFSAGATIHLAANTIHHVVAETGGDTRLALRLASADMAFRSETGSAIDYYFFYGPEPARVIAEYRNLTGAAPLLPRWAYGFWQCRERYASQQEILDIAAEFRKRKIPVDVLVQDWQYWGKYGWNAMRFDERQYPDPAAMMSELHKQNLHLVISVWAKFGAETAINREMQASHLVLTSAASTAEPGETQETESWADLFNPKAQNAFWSDIDRNLFSLGLDGWWLDASEPEGDPLKKDVTFLGPGVGVRNAFPLFETSAVYEGQRAATEDKRVVILSRSAYAGQQRNGSISWSGDITGDWESFRRQIPAGLNFGMSGFPYWTTDVGGFFRPADQYTSPEYRELLVRWFQFGAFCPIFRIHGFHSETEMWKYGSEVEDILQQYDRLRYRLLPYIYSSAWGVTDRGQILMKALPFVYPEDARRRQISDQFLFGDSLLVNPVTEPHVAKRSVLLPAADGWVDFWTGRSYRGGQTIVAEAPLNRIPILVKKGSIVPLGPVVQSASEQQDPLEIRIYPGRDASFEMYEDSGDGYAYEHGAKSIVPLHWDDHQRVLSIGDRSGSFPEMLRKRTMRIVLVGPDHGVGENPTEGADRTLTYEGHGLKIVLADKR
jgi:alpha-D-xyloside xylohydrolase